MKLSMDTSKARSICQVACFRTEMPSVYTLADECYIVRRTEHEEPRSPVARGGVVRYLTLISLTVFLASGLVVLVDARTGPDPRRPPLQPDQSREVRTLYQLQPLHHEDYPDVLQAGPEEEHSA